MTTLTQWQLIRRSMAHYWRLHVVVGLGVAVACAILTGSLLVGDSVRATLRSLARERLGEFDQALVTPRFFRVDLAQRVADRLARGGAAPSRPVAVLLVDASAASQARDDRPALRAGGVTLAGIDAAFGRRGFPPQTTPGGVTVGEIAEDDVVLNESLATELRVAVDDHVILNLERQTAAPLESFLGSRADRARSLRLRIARILPDRGAGLFSLRLGQAAPRLAYMQRERLARALDVAGRANVLLLDSDGGEGGAEMEAGAESEGDSDTEAEADRESDSESETESDSDSGAEGTAPGTPQSPDADTVAPSDSASDSDTATDTDTDTTSASGADLGAEASRLRVARLALRESLELDDLGLRVSSVDELGYLSVETRRMILEDRTLGAIADAASQLGARTSTVLTHLAERIAVTLPGENGSEEERSIPYSTIAALQISPQPPFGPFRLRGDGVAPPLETSEIYLNSWAADDLGIEASQVGEVSIVVDYYVTESDVEAETDRATFTLGGIVELAGPAADPHLTPEFPGITSKDVRSMRQWDPPFEIDLTRIRDQDEEYWEAHRATPKAFVSPRVGEECFESRFGSATSMRLAPPEGITLEGLRDALRRELLRDGDLPATLGFTWRPVRQEALAAASGNTPFGVLFVSFSFFLIIAAALLIALLFTLQIDRRAQEMGTLLASGQTARQVRRFYLSEALAVASLGGLLGVAFGLGYAAFLLHGLSTWWWDAVRVPYLAFSVHPLTLVIGLVCTEVVVLVAIALASRGMKRAAVRPLLAGVPLSAQLRSHPLAQPRKSLFVALGAAVGAVILAIVSVLAGGVQVALFFGVGTLALIAGLAALSYWLHRTPGERSSQPALAVVGMRNARLAPRRSLLTAALVAAATFILVVVAANQHDATHDAVDRSSGNGGFALVATSEVPLTESLDTEGGREALALAGMTIELPDGERQEVDWSGMRSYALRVKPGDDTSCLNLYAPQNPRVLGVPDSFIDRGGFVFKSTLAESPMDEENPWRLLRDSREGEPIPAIADANSATWILKKGLGDLITVDDGAGGTRRLKLVATLATSFFQGELLIHEDAFRQAFPHREGHAFFAIDLDPLEKRSQIELALESGLSAYGFDATEPNRLIAAFLEVENTYLSTFQLLGGLGLLLGTLGLGIVLVRGVIERRGELALLSAVGFSRARLSWLVLAENLLLLVAGLGTGFAAAALAVLPRWLDPATEIPWTGLATLLGSVAAVGLASGLIAVAVTVRSDVLPLLKQEH